MSPEINTLLNEGVSELYADKSVMKLPEQIVLTAAGPDSDVTVTFDEVDDYASGTKTYTSPSPQGDLKGKPTFQVSNSTSSKGLTRTLAKNVSPKYDSGDEEYEGFTQISTTINRPETLPITTMVADLNIHIALLEELRDELANGAY
jgi:hypothetical protein